MDKALVVITALILSVLLGIFWSKPLPGAGYVAQVIRSYERKLNRRDKSVGELELRGQLFIGMIVAGSIFCGWLFSFASPVFTILLIAVLIPTSSSWMRVGRIKHYLQGGNIVAARQQFESMRSRHLAVMDHAGLIKTAIEYLAMQFLLKIISPIFWFFIFGIPGFVVAVMVTHMQEIFASAGSNHSPFHKAGNYCYEIVHYIPARFCALLWLLSFMFFSGNKIKELWQKLLLHIADRSPVYIILLVAAGGLNLVLGGRNSVYYPAGLIGSGRIEATTSDITRAQFIYIVSGLIMFVGLGIFI